MILKALGEISPGFHLLGHVPVPTHLYLSPRPVLFDAGFMVLGRSYEKAVRQVLGQGSPEILFLTHAHFDHLGAAGYLKRVFPGLKVAASEKAADIVRRPNAVALITQLNRNVAEALAGLDGPDLLKVPFEPFEVDIVLKEGDSVDLGNGKVVEVLATPGHTWDFLSYYLPAEKILIPSESVGCLDPSGRHVVCDFLVDYEVYLENVRRQSALDVDILCQGHYFVYTGRDVPEFFRRSFQDAETYQELVERLLDEAAGDEEEVLRRLKEIEYDPLPRPKQPEPAYLLNSRARIRYFAGRRSKNTALPS